jgi:hypothetical protein
MIRISQTSKLDSRSWSLEALDTCPASKNADGTLVDACSGCYATTGNYRFSNVKAPRIENKLDWTRLEWTDEMVALLDQDRYFRWFDSGDLYALPLAEKILEVMKRTPWVKHWMPTRMHKFPKFRGVLREMQSLPNVSLRFSSDSINGEFIKGLHGSVIIPSPDQLPKGATLCEAYSRMGKCGGCRSCWDKSVSLIAYPAHGKKMNKVISIKVSK